MSIRSRTGQGESITEMRRALQHFTNRKNSIRHFASYLNDDPAKEQILFFHGDGGNGKTILLRFLRERCCKRLDADNWEYIKGLEGDDFIENFTGAIGCAEVPSSLIDFAMEPRGEYRPKEAFSALLRMRRDLSGCGLRFPLYDFACILYLHKTGRLSKDRLKNLFPQEEADVTAALIDATLDAFDHSSWGSIAKSFLSLINKQSQEWFTLYLRRRGIDDEKQIEELQGLDPEAELYEQFPILFAEDLNASMTLEGAPKLDFVHFYKSQMAVSVSSLFSAARLFRRQVFNVMFKNSGFENKGLAKPGLSGSEKWTKSS